MPVLAPITHDGQGNLLKRADTIANGGFSDGEKI